MNQQAEVFYDEPPSDANALVCSDGWQITWQQTEATQTPGWALKVQTELPVILHVARMISENDSKKGHSSEIKLFCFDTKMNVHQNALRLASFLVQMSGTTGIWAPISSNHSLLLMAFQQARSVIKQLDLSRSPMIFIGDASNEKSFEAISSGLDMPFHFQASY
ncbi:MAG: hypothetical protein ACPGYX_08410 [Oceanobacter sp.]